MASTHDISQDYFGIPFQGLMKIKIDSSDTDLFPVGIVQNATVTLANIPAGCIIRGAQLYVETAQADISDVDLGTSTDGSTNDGLIDGVTLATGDAYVFTAGIAASIPVVADSTLVFTNKDAQTLATGVVWVIVDIVDGRIG